MAIKFQYNKTYLNQLNKELKVRLNALPTLKAKESALRFEVKRARDEMKVLRQNLINRKNSLEPDIRLWKEFPEGLVSVKELRTVQKKTAGVRTPELESVVFETADYSWFTEAGWVPDGVAILKELAELTAREHVAAERLKALEFARKKTTQKVNLYEKVQIPDYQEAILKIKRFLEDEENLAKASQKILKARISAAEAAETADAGAKGGAA
jgi:V/A-type H+-transporting ATPase subunit D